MLKQHSCDKCVDNIKYRYLQCLFQRWSMFMLFIVILSVIVLVLDTVMDFRKPDGPDFEEQFQNVTHHRLIFMYSHSKPRFSLLLSEFLMILIVTTEFFMRLITSPRKRTFISNPKNYLSLISLLPTWIMIPLRLFHLGELQQMHGSIFYVYFISLALRIFRLVDLYRLSKHYKTFKILLLCVKASYKELILFITVLWMTTLIFANLIYFVEIAEDNFMSIPQSLWWSMITLTTVGYGDKYPVSYQGYLVGSACAITGILVVAFPIPILSNNFTTYYKYIQSAYRIQQRNKNKSGKH